MSDHYSQSVYPRSVSSDEIVARYNGLLADVERLEMEVLRVRLDRSESDERAYSANQRLLTDAERRYAELHGWFRQIAVYLGCPDDEDVVKFFEEYRAEYNARLAENVRLAARLRKWEEWQPDDETLRVLKAQAAANKGGAAQVFYIGALEYQLQRAELPRLLAENARLQRERDAALAENERLRVVVDAALAATAENGMSMAELTVICNAYHAKTYPELYCQECGELLPCDCDDEALEGK